MVLQRVLVGGRWQEARSPEGTFQPSNPAGREKLPDAYPVSSFEDIDLALRTAHEAIEDLRSISPDAIASFLEAFAGNIEARREELVAMSNLETALPKEPRLNSVELPRTTNQLRQAAAAARGRSWCHATIDTKNNIRSMYAPLVGPVVVFGPNNFPFAFNSVAGGDFAAAIAAGNPVIAKANPAHPGTTRLLAECAFEAVQSSDLPAGMVQLVYRLSGESGQRLVSHPMVGATGFTGSRAAGMKLKAAADRGLKPIYLEMSSVNPVYVLPGALRERLESVASEFATSSLQGAGQFCTNPGLVMLLEGEPSEHFLEAVSRALKEASPGVLLTENGPHQIEEAVGVMLENGAQVVVGGSGVPDAQGYSFQNTLLRAGGDAFLERPDRLQTEAFGSVALFVFARDEAQLLEMTLALEGNLTGSIYSDTGGSDDALYSRLAPLLRRKVGRLLNDKMPTGVAVSPAMVHGGPPPSTGHPGFTAVGIPASMLRFAALQCYDNVRSDRLPPELGDKNPTGHTWRLIDGEWSRDDAQPPRG
jgi:alpha-ketoglutaric semialdehyde dehydrogenase